MMGKLPPERVWMRRTISTVRAVSGAPPMRPLPILSSDSRLVCSPSRSSDPFVATMPSSGVVSRMSLMRSIASSDMSGETLSMMGRYWFCPRRKSKSGSRIRRIFSREWLAPSRQALSQQMFTVK